MSRTRLFTGLVGATALGLVVGLLAGEPRQVSVELWIAAATAWLGWIVLGQLTTTSPVRSDRFGGLGLRRRQSEPDSRPRSLAALEGLLANAAHSQRAATIRLRPRLETVTARLLRTRHGIDAATDRERAQAVLADVAWIVDSDVELERSPTPAEIERLLALAMGDHEGSR